MWFENLMGFVEESPEQVRANIEHDGETLVFRVNGQRVRCGRLETPSLAELRRSAMSLNPGLATTVTEVVGDVGTLHRDPDNARALFQAASQFNLLEMSTGVRSNIATFSGDPARRRPLPAVHLPRRSANWLITTSSPLGNSATILSCTPMASRKRRNVLRYISD